MLRPLADALAHQPTAPGPAGGTGQAAAGEPDQPDLPLSELLWQAAQSATELRVRSGAAASPAGLAEATAALQDLALQLAPAAGEHRLAQLRQLQHGLPAQVQVATDGPYLVTNVPLTDYLGEPIPASPQLATQLALCRCGGSAIKPLCDGTHARNGFSGAKDPKRVPDRQDSYPGADVTILDNRGLCQHSGFCSDRLPAVFRAGQEPFVAPGGGRLDEIIHAVRDCPSGALGLPRAGRAGPGRAARPRPGIEVTRDGPYRLTGGVTAGGRGRDAGAPQPGRLPGALRAVPVRPVAEQAVLQRHALVRGLPRPGPAGSRPCSSGPGAARADQMDQVALREARGRRPGPRPGVRRPAAGTRRPKPRGSP